MADAELANDLKKLTTAKVDKAHPGQLLYVHWINCVNESRSIIKQYGLMPEIKDTEDLLQLLPPMACIYDWIESGKDKDMCLSVADHFYSKATTASRRSLAKQSFYKEKSSLVTHLKLMHAAALKRLKGVFTKDFAKVPFLRAGTYCGCKEARKDLRDSLCYRDGEGPENKRFLDRFNGFRLTTNERFLTPQSTAAHLFEPKNAASSNGKAMREMYQEIVANWRRDNNYRPYLPMPVIIEKPANNRRGSGGANSKVDDSKALTKVKFREPMKKLGKALEECLKEHVKNKQEHILTDVLDKYNVIQKMVGYGKTLTIKQQGVIDEDYYNEDEVGDESEDDEVQDNDESYSEDADGSSGSDTESGSISDTESSDDEENKSNASKNNDAESDASVGGDNDDAVGNRARDDNTEDPPEGTNKAIPGNNVAVGDSTNGAADGDNSHGESKDNDEHSNDDNGHDVDGKNGPDKEDALTVLTNHIDRELKGKVHRSKMPAVDIQRVLFLTKKPNFQWKAHRAYFCSLQSDDMKLIKKIYEKKNDSEEFRAEIANKEWIPSLVRLMLDLNWSSSVKDLPEESTYNEEDEILLWNPIVSEKFM